MQSIIIDHNLCSDRMLQGFAGINATGEMDNATTMLMESSRCGIAVNNQSINQSIINQTSNHWPIFLSISTGCCRALQASMLRARWTTLRPCSWNRRGAVMRICWVRLAWAIWTSSRRPVWAGSLPWSRRWSRRYDVDCTKLFIIIGCWLV